MTRSPHRLVSVPAAILIAAVLGRTNNLAAQQNVPPGQTLQQVESVEQQGVETLTRGPIHEAFAEVVPYDPQPGITVPNQPPEPVNEIPPEQRPDNENVIWIPGYWSWSEDQNDFIWISGVWRVPPPGCQWVPGYWNQIDNGYQWISGYWWCGGEQGQEEQMTYLPVPPDTLESGPSSPQPADDQFWVPGVWIWQDTQYVWRPGYWAQIRPNWVWIPDHYIWTPVGCVFIAGHWDYTMPRRGLCFAPVHLQPAVYTQPTFRYVPVVLIDVYVVHYHLFCRPANNHYYFGDYYDPRYREIGIWPWFDLYRGGEAYEPFYVYNRWYFRHHEPDRDWSQRIRRWYDYRVRHPDARPPHTYRAMQDLLRRDGHRQPELLEVALSFDRAKNRKEFPIKLTPVDEQYRDRMIDLRTKVRDFSEERVRQEKQLRQRFADGKPDRPQRIKFSEPPVRGERVGLGQRPERPGQAERQDRTLPEVPGKPGAKEQPDVPSFPAPDIPESPPDTPDAGRPEAPGKAERPGKPERRPERSGKSEAPEKPEMQAPAKPEAPQREKGPPTDRERPERQPRREAPGFRGEPRQQPEGPETQRQPKQPDQRGPRQRPFQTPGPQRGPQEQPGARDQHRDQGPSSPRGQQERFGRPGGEPPQRPQGFRQPDRSEQQPDAGFPGQPQGQRQRDRFDRPDAGRQGSQPRQFGAPEQAQGFQGQSGPQRSGRDAGPQSPGADQGPRGGRPDASPFRSPGGGDRDGARSRQTPDFGGGRSDGRDFQRSSPQGSRLEGGRPEGRPSGRGGDDERGPRRGRDAD